MNYWKLWKHLENHAMKKYHSEGLSLTFQVCQLSVSPPNKLALIIYLNFLHNLSDYLTTQVSGIFLAIVALFPVFSNEFISIVYLHNHCC